MWMIRRLGVVAVLISLVPFALLALTCTFAWVFACKGGFSAGPLQCPVLGVDIGGLIGSLFLLSFVLIPYLVPPAAGIAMAWILIELINLVRLRWFS
jgi:hypothetical protein